MKNKSVLVIDTPENCHDCPIIDYCHNNDGKCNLLIIPDWCPLSPLPPHKDLTEYINNANYAINSMLAYQYAQGWNSCRDEILKGKE